ncbi:MAG: flagellar protein FliT [Gammaproteobacteria bacterium]
MLRAARNEDWATVSRLERRIRDMADNLRRDADRFEVAPDERREQLRVLRRLVLMDGDVRRLAHPWNRTLDAMFSPTSLDPRLGGSRA